MAALAAMIAGCAVDSAGSDPDLDQTTAEASDQLDYGCVTEDTVELERPDVGNPDPDPDPWEPARAQKQQNPTDPDDIRTNAPPGAPSNHDET